MKIKIIKMKACYYIDRIKYVDQEANASVELPAGDWPLEAMG